MEAGASPDGVCEVVEEGVDSGLAVLVVDLVGTSRCSLTAEAPPDGLEAEVLLGTSRLCWVSLSLKDSETFSYKTTS